VHVPDESSSPLFCSLKAVNSLVGLTGMHWYGQSVKQASKGSLTFVRSHSSLIMFRILCWPASEALLVPLSCSAALQSGQLQQSMQVSRDATAAYLGT
jgi:hypothetical protein